MSALVLDCSRSMFAGMPGSRPVDIALSELSTRPALSAADRYLLVFDLKTRKSRLLPWRSVVAANGLESPSSRADVAARLLSVSPLFSVDYSILESLPSRGYRSVTLMTDYFPMEARGLTIMETGFAGRQRGLDLPENAKTGSLGPVLDEGAPAVWPAAIRYDRTRSAWLASFVESGRRGALSVEQYDPGRGIFASLPATRYSIEERREGRRVAIAATGSFRFIFADPAGGIPCVFAATLTPAEIPAYAEGSFSELVLRALPYLVVRPRPAVALVDKGREAEARKMGAALVLTTELGVSDPFLADPGLLGARPLAEGLLPSVDFAWGSASLANPDLPLAYDSTIRAAGAPAFTSVFPSAAAIRSGAGGAWLLSSPSSLLAIDPPSSEFFQPGRSGILELRVPPRQGLWASLLALLVLGKFIVWKYLSRNAAPASKNGA